jgi:hypothetical protein
MRQTFIKTDEAPCKWYAAQDARIRNIANKSHYDAATQLRVDRMKGLLEFIYAARGVYEAYGKKGISIKVEGARVRDRAALISIERDWEQQGVVKKVTPQGVIYRIQK